MAEPGAAGTRRVAVVGGGITGLAAAWELERNGVDVVVFEATDRVGGKLEQSSVPGLSFPLDEGADAFLARVPDALDLCAELGIDELVHPATGQAYVYVRRGLHPLPSQHLLGIPTDLDDLAATGLVSGPAIEDLRAELDSTEPGATHDETIGALVRRRLGDEVCDHLVGPLIGGINAGEVDQLSAAAVAPQIWACARQGGSLLRAAAEARSRAVTTGAPVFAAPAEGMAELPRRLADRLAAEIRLATPAPALMVEDGTVRLGDDRFDGVVVATPAPVAADLLGDAAPDAARLLGGIELASVAMVTLVFARADLDRSLDGSGFLVARTAGLDVTACSWASSKWSHWDDGEHVVLRASIGHHADPVDWCAEPDETVLDAVLRGLRITMDLDAEPVGYRIGRWAASLPQYRPGHLDLVTDVHRAAAEAGPIAVAGAALEGLGVPACIRQGRDAARRMLG